MDIRKQAIKDLLDGCPVVFGKLLKEIDETKYYDRPEYKQMMKVKFV